MSSLHNSSLLLSFGNHQEGFLSFTIGNHNRDVFRLQIFCNNFVRFRQYFINILLQNFIFVQFSYRHRLISYPNISKPKYAYLL